MNPIKKTIQLNCTIHHAFRIFTEKVHIWWPGQYRTGGKKESSMVFETRVDGAFYSIDNAGQRKEFGKIVRWEPPERMTFDWSPGRSDSLQTQVDVRFQTSASGTRVELVHSPILNTEGAFEKSAPGFAKAWVTVLDHFQEFVGNLGGEDITGRTVEENEHFRFILTDDGQAIVFVWKRIQTLKAAEYRSYVRKFAGHCKTHRPRLALIDVRLFEAKLESEGEEDFHPWWTREIVPLYHAAGIAGLAHVNGDPNAAGEYAEVPPRIDFRMGLFTDLKTALS